MEKGRPGLEVVLHVQDDRPEKRLTVAPKWTAALHRCVTDASLNTHLPSFDSPVDVEEERPSYVTPTWHASDRPEPSGRSS